MRIRNDLARVKRKTLLDVECLARDHTQKAIRELVRIMKDENVAANVRVLAAEKILELGWGRLARCPRRLLR
jgi:hypothetical protein